jgi:hypothetical protein
MPIQLPVIKIVGMSASGKSTLVKGLRAAGYDARPVSQEHSNIPDLWRQFDASDYGKPMWLIYLDASLDSQRARRPDVSWSGKWWRTEQARLHHARAHADLRIDTSEMSPLQVLDLALLFLQGRGVAHADGPLPSVAPTGGVRK